MKMKMRIRRLLVGLLGAFLIFFVTACSPTKPTDTTVTTTLADSNITTTHPSPPAETTAPHTQENTRSDKTTITTTASQSTTSKPTSITYPQKYKAFTSLDDYCHFAKTVDEQELRSFFTKKNYDGSQYFDEKTFEIILQDRQYLLPVIPTGYTFKGIELATINPMVIAFERDEKEYAVCCRMSKTKKRLDVEENDSFFKQDGTKVTVAYYPSNAVHAGGGTCYWEESGYQCFTRFTKENKEQMWDFIKSFELKIVSIE